ncbi:vacuolar protein sorting-associated protein 13C isoform X1 [Hippoglossus hippoglossus]|uniref:vacuolar protein sorting-associated protein 13C isoform X1 n=1 Tax=Hippoglossus hippoglossus TaxID=8267 RepID=UPI00148D4B4B|nr:vacuolar protein sorting-associated protein 13C isoform X1 [Hippoglossus hippoglossus]XP_034470801.1 vacuolar protein sorting-associated protein 13C isoform X1 [Hippoglossus hippoglossus]
MVFESLVSDLLNRFIGDYVENLDKSQLKIGIWGGNVVLENLRVKENALSDFNVPFKVKAGQIGRLTLKIPWKNLYNDAVVATLDGLYLLVVPGATIKFDAAKEERYQQEAKQRELQRIEEALQMAARRASQTGDLLFSLESVVYKEPQNVPKGFKKHKKHKKGLKKLKGLDNKSEKPQEEKKDTLMEKLATQVIKNLQVKISSIHLRFEDDLSDPEHPLSVGVTLSELSLLTTDENWKSCILNEAAKIIYKLGRLECLCAYWNVNSPIFYKGSWDEIVTQLKSGISSSDQQLPHYHYIFKPIFASAKMCINPNAELELKTPKAKLHLEVQNIAIEMTKPQYLTMVDLLESINCMVKNAPYRKFRPEVSVHKNTKLWWRYGLNSILEVHIRRYSHMWSWSNIRRHRENLKTYKSVYKTKLSQGKSSPDTERRIQELEKVLDVFNITLARQQAQMEVIRSGQKVVAKKAAGGQKQGGGFFSSLFGRKNKKEEREQEESKETESSGLDELMTTDEKEKLYSAIGYSGSSHSLTLPKQYVAVVVSFQLLRTSVTLRELPDVPETLKIQMIDLSTKISQRPGAQAIRVEAALEHWYVTGLQQQGAIPSLIASVGDSSSSLLNVVFELNPEESAADQLIRVQSQPVEIIYDALTVNSMVEFFQTGKGVDLEVLTSATLSKLEEIKEKTATGLSHIIETRKVLDLRIDLKPSYLLIPKSGFYSDESDLIIVDFGSLQLNSVDQSSFSSSTSSFSSLEEIMDRAYERFNVELRRVQVLYSKSGEVWKSARLQGSSLQHILQPMDFTLHLAKCLVAKDARMPRFKVSGELPLLHVKISDQKIQDVFELVQSIPLPDMGSSPSTPTEKILSLADVRPRALSLPPGLLDAMETDSDEDVSEKSIDEDLQRTTLEELIDVHFQFEVKEVLLELTRQEDEEKTVLSFSVCQLGAEGKRRSFDLSATSYLRSVTLDYCGDDRTRPLHLISSSEQQSSNLLKVEFIKADPKGPSFQTLFDNTEQTLKVEFSSLDFLLHTKALLSTISYLSSALPSDLSTARDRDTKKQVEKTGPGRTVSKGVKDGGVYSFKLFAVLGCFHVEVCDDRCSIADIRVQGIDASVLVQAKETEVFARLRDIVVTDVNLKTVHRKAVSIMGEEVFSFKLVLFPGATEGDGYSDMSKVDGKVTMRLGCINIIYLHKFLMSLLASFCFQYSSADEMFVDNFQTAKEALSAATAQAAEKAVSSVRDFAQKSFRLSMDIKLKAPLIIIPQSSTSQNAVVVDLGLITVENSFSLLPVEGFSLPAVVEKMDVKLTQLKLSRTVLRPDSSQLIFSDIEILQPINLELLVTRNLAASWFTKIPAVQVQGVLRSLNMSLGEEDLGVLMKILVENIGEGSKAHDMDVKSRVAQEKAALAEQQVEVMSPQVGSAVIPPTIGAPTENIINVLLNFEIKEVLLTLKKPREKTETPFLVLHVAQLGIDTKVRKYDMCATTYIKKITMKCLEFKDSSGEPLCLVSSSVESGAELLKVQYFKADRSAPNFSTNYKNTEQMMNVTFTSLNVLLHTEALLSTIDFLSTALMSDGMTSSDKDVKQKTDEKTPSAKSTATMSPADSDVIELKVMMSLGAFNVLVCDQSCNMADIKIQGVHGSLLKQGAQTIISARLRDVVVLDVDSQTIHSKAVSIVGDEVFSFSMSLTPNATEGAGYADTSQTDGKVKLNVGCIQVVYLHKFFMSLLNFSSNFQTAKEALSAATAQAAEKAASSVRDFAKKSFRLSMDVKLKAPLIVVPQSSTSQNALVMDLGLITVGNSFSLLPVDGCPLPAVVDNMDVELTQLKLSRTCLDLESDRPSIELLEPVNLHLNIKRNLSASWYKKMAAVEIDGDLKPMMVELCQEDLKVLLRILMENLGEAGSLQPTAPKQEEISLPVRTAGTPPADVVKSSVSRSEEEDEALESVKFQFNIESLGLVLYSDDPQQPLQLQHLENLRLGEFTLRLLKTSGRMFASGSMEVTTVLTDCTLDDLRTGMERVTSRMVRRRDERSSETMIDVTYRQSAAEREVVAVLQKLYLCVSVEFLMAVADFFLQALPQASALTTASAPGDRLPLRQTAEPRADAKTAAAAVRTRLRAVVVDPEVVFVASLMKADAPALVASFQCDFSLQAEGDRTQNMKTNLRELKVLACPFIRNEEGKAVTTVLKPCSVVLETKTHPNQPLSGSVTVEEVIVKISPFIINTVMTITAAMTPKQPDEQSPDAAGVADLWSVMNIYDCNYWFLGVDQATEVTESFNVHDGRNQGESFAAEVKVVQVTLESGLGHQTVPLLLAESSFSGSAKNWSSLLQLKANMTLEVNYFNEIHAVWEPLIERVDGGSRRWNLELEMKNNLLQDKSPIHGDDFVILPEPRTAINICSKDTMNITVSQCSLNVFHNLTKAFSEGTASTFDPYLKEKAPFTIRNSLGIPLIVQHSATLRLVGLSSQGKLHELSVDQSMDLEHSMFDLSSRGKLSALQRQESCLFNLTIVPTGYSEIANVAVDKPGRRLYNIRGPMLQEAVSVLLQIDAAEGNKVITIRSPLQIKNHFSVPFTVLRYCPTSRSLESVGQAEPGTEFHVALETYRCQLFVRPAGPLDGQYGPSSTCVSWKEQVHRSSEVRSLLQCPATDRSLLPLMVCTLAVPDDLRHIASHGEEDWDPAYIIHLHPVVTLRNLLPYTVHYMMESSADSYKLQEGGTSDLLNARVAGEIMSLVLTRYQGRDWHGHVRIRQDMPEFFTLSLTCDSDNLTVDVSIHVTRTTSQLLLSLFSPYWIINKTSRVLQYRAEDVSVKHPADFRDIVLFSFRKKTVFSKSKLQLSVSTSSWSDGFSLDTVGSYGCVRCPDNNMDFLVGVSIQLSSFNLTRIVTMSPFFTLVNKSSYELEVGEVRPTSTRWHYISTTECLPLWPQDPLGKLCVRVVGSESSSKFFFFNRQDSGTLMSLDMCGGIIVDVNISDHSTVISFTDYYDGAAPALMINHTPWVTISFRQSGSKVVHELKPGQARRFVWDDPAGVRTLSWSCMEHSGELDLLKDDVGQFSYDSLSQVHWVSFLDGRQRVVLFTEDVAVVTKARQAEELEQFQQEVKVSLQNLGLSLINNTSQQEIAYIGITSSGVVWELKPKNRWKPFSQKNINLLEKTYQSQLSRKTEGGWVKLESNLEVNLSGAIMMMRQPISCPVRRNFLSGIQVELKQSLHQRSLRAQLHWLQVDNQLPGAIFPIVFHPVSPPKSIALDSEPKPFIDVSIITRFNQHSNVMQFKYFMALVQEMAVKLDQGFLGAILAVFAPAADPQANKQKSRLIDRDLQLLQAELMEASLSDMSGLSFFEHFHISPVKLHLSLSLGSSGDDVSQEPAAVQSLNLLLKSLGASLTDVDDLIFKLAFFEVKFQFYRREKLMWTVVRHYTEQFLRQMYVLVLGLDVLGNPFGLIRGLSEGVEAFFYEPFQGAVQGPEEFAEGLVIGVRSLLGHTVGGAAGMVSRITGSVGKGLAAITMDKEYQQKRREEMNRPPKDFGASLAKGGKGLLKGVVGGFTGIVTKPVEGAKKEGAAGFFKGIGKGLVGVVARPTGGIVDMASSTFQGIQRVAESTEEVTRLRPVRLIREDGIIRPYDLTESQGFDLFQRSQIQQLDGEVFRRHCLYPGHSKTNIIITNRRVLCVKEINFVGHFNKEWECLFENFYRPPAVTGSELSLYCKEQQKLKLPMRDEESVRKVQLRDTNTAQALQAAISDAQAAQKQHRMARQKSQRFLKLDNKH